ncbi:hypothetical protein M0812_17336 [Anaeramoeba flamelloides]|uniref:Uncharacterized protein n=1 Tax=Anaeramoeba flamelloides TaxID=1746091 RepID=A0AAV7ZAI7_9EUKA|nr:hypothetical protein M0812_17336 [Anaeramoeba flamelloides]|eukprot:Anaeramoba_flamelloidesa595813_146.p1 GENE.a595813_146~~a595813_146.p1  ORF type:complete len:238 (+),score=48.31 a595813_146:59-772(+)
MSLKPNLNLTNEERAQLIEKLKIVRSMEERLKILKVLFPQSITGLDSNDKTTFQDQPNTNEVRLNRHLLTFLSEITKVSRRSLERGLSSFFERKYGFQNIRPYSRSSLIFGNSQPISVRKKQVIVRLKKTNEILNQKPKINLQSVSRQENSKQNLKKTKKIVKLNTKTDQEQFSDILPMISSTLISLKMSKRHSSPSFQERKRTFSNHNNNQFSALQMLCELSQLQKIRKTNLNQKI